MKNAALVVSGGGAKGAFAVGVVKHLYQTYRDDGWFSICGGSSTGALIAPMAALMAADAPMRDEALQNLIVLYTTVKTSDILEHQSIFEFIGRRDCLNESDPLNDLIHRHLTQDRYDWLETADAPKCYVVYTNYQTGEKIHVTPRDSGVDREAFIQAMMASASVPVLMEATVIEGAVCYDGGVRDLVPFGHAIKLGAERILPVHLDPSQFPHTSSRFRRIDKVLLRTLAIMLDEAAQNDGEMAELINEGVRAREEILGLFKDDPDATARLTGLFGKDTYKKLLGENNRLVDLVHGLRPAEPLTDDALAFDPAQMTGWLAMGEQVASEVISANPFE